MAEAGIYAALDTVTALGSRIYPRKLPQNVEYPAAVYQRIGPTNRFSSFGRDEAPVEATYQVDVYDQADRGITAFETLYESVRRAIQRVSNTQLLDTYLDSQRGDYEDETNLFRESF